MITSQQVSMSRRAENAGKIFGIRFIWVESFVFDTASSLSPAYDGGLWEFYALSNGGFYMAPASGKSFSVACDNRFDGVLSADAFGMTICLYVYSMLSFSPDEPFAQLCASQYHLLREFMAGHVEAASIFRAID